MDRSALGKILLLAGMASYVSMGVLLGLYFNDFAKRSLTELWILFVASSIGLVITARAMSSNKITRPGISFGLDSARDEASLFRPRR
jgi:hypothetical protein